jgi:hypothetical protein
MLEDAANHAKLTMKHLGATLALQTKENHTRRDFAYLALAVLNLTLLIMAVRQLIQFRNGQHWVIAGLALSTLSAGIAVRRYALMNQNRLIRLEENVRLHWMGVDPSGLTMAQMIALRFASDAESPALVARTVAEKLTPKQIKEAIVNWRPDLDRV